MKSRVFRGKRILERRFRAAWARGTEALAMTADELPSGDMSGQLTRCSSHADTD